MGMSCFDTLVAQQNGYEGGDDDDSTQWVTDALENDSFFTAVFEGWKVSERFRLVTALGAWFGCCAVIWQHQQIIPALQKQQRETQGNLGQWKQLAKELQGAPGALDKYAGMKDKALAASVLRKLVDMQQEGLDRTREFLSMVGGGGQ
jgi:hypothetical protein